MSYVELSGVGDEVSGEKIVYELNAQGFACKGMSISREGGNKVITFDLDDGKEEAAYRNAQTPPDLLIKISDALERAGVYIDTSTPRSEPRMTLEAQTQTTMKMRVVKLQKEVDRLESSDFELQATTTKPPPSSPPYGSVEWAKQILPGDLTVSG